MKLSRRFPNLAAVLWVCGIWSLLFADATAQLPQIENGIRNVLSQQGVPPDPEPPGPTARTGNQFSSISAFGGWIATRVTDGDGNVVAGSSSGLAGAPGDINLPSYTPLQPDLVTPDTSKTIQLDSVQMGRSMVLRTVSFSLGSEIPRPDRRPDGSALDPLVFSEAEFYLREPANIDSGAFYWSPHAEKVYANQPGNITIQWVERVSGDVFEKTYTISGSPSKPAKKLYWTDGDFNGPLVSVPDTRVSQVNVVYTANFPARVASEPAAGAGAQPAPGELVSYDYDPEDPFDPAAPGIRPPPETRTLWYDGIGNAIHAYNLEGRVFVELLGDLREPDRVYREHLGFEIVDVIKEQRPYELKVAIGERVLPVDEADMTEEDDALIADVVAGLGLGAEPYLFEHLSLGGSERTLYAIRATTPIVVLDRNGDGRIDQLDEQQSNEVLIYWKESGVMRLEWPKKYVGYIFKWPEEYLAGGVSETELRDFYSLYARPEAGADDYAETGVQLNSEDNPVLTYQDDATRQHAQITAQNIFYTTPGNGSRSLIRYTKGDEIWFERVYSLPNTEFSGYGLTVPMPVGSRIEPPADIADSVGYIRQSSGNGFNPGGYVDPFVAGFDAAKRGAIIGVNAMPGNDELEVWWYEPSSPGSIDFAPTYWPSQVRHYKLYLPSAVPPGALYSTRVPDEVLSSPQTLPTYNRRSVGDVGSVDSKDATFVLDVDFSNKSTGNPEMIWETGATGTGSALVYEVGNVLRLAWKDDSLREVSYVLTPEEIDAGMLRVAWTFDINTLAPEQLKLLVNGRLVASETFSFTTPSWSGTNGASFGVGGFNALGAAAVPFTSGNLGALQFFGDALVSQEENLVAGLDDDFDTLPDRWERAFFPLDLGQLSPGGDYDRDGLSDEDEYLAQWDPTRSDTDGDGVRDDLDSEAFVDPIIMASNAGSGDLGIAATGSIYRQPDPDLPGYNPNEEHALMSGGVAWALRDDLNLTGEGAYSSEPFVLVDYRAEDGRPAMVFRQVLRETAQFTFDYEAPVGRILQAPMPLPVMPLPIDASGVVANVEVGNPTDPATYEGGSVDYDKFTYVDRKGATWIYRGAHAEAVNIGAVTDPAMSFTMHYYYESQAAFDFPGRTTPEVGTIIPYLSEGPVLDPIENTIPADITFIPVWPDEVAVLEVAETLGLPKNGLPAARGQTSLKVLYEQSRANEGSRSAKLIDPTRQKVFAFQQRHLDTMGRIVTSNYRGKLYFPQLPPHLSERLFYDPNRGDLGALVFTGEFVDEILGEDYYLLNTMSEQEMLDVKNLAEGDADWAEAIDGLSTTVETFVESSPGSGVFDSIAVSEDVGITGVVEIDDSDTAVDSYAISAAGGGTGYVVVVAGDGEAFTPPGEPVSIEVFKVVPRLYTGELKVVGSANPLDEKLTLQHSGDFGGDPAGYEFAWITGQPVSGFPPEAAVANLSLWQEVTSGAATDAGEAGKVRHTIEGASILTLTDNYFAMRYRAKAGTAAALATGGDQNNPGDWSTWTKPQLAEGWIKRALAGINPFEQRITDLFSNEVNTSVSLVSQAGPRWEGNIALNLENIDDFGLIEIYETILRRGIGLSIDGAPPLNVPAANDALLLAAGYLNDLYMLLGNEAFADAANPTIAFSSDSGQFGTSAQFGELNTALFAFKGQVATVLDEELNLLRGRDNRLQPGVETTPIYNRLVWNYTNGINAGEAVYALNYNIKDLDASGAADAVDAATQYPQGHGDAYGHYLTALKGYYSLLRSDYFAWTPRIEAVSVLGQPVSIDYQDERKFAAAAAAVARTASETLDLTYRKEFNGSENAGWSHLRDDDTGRAWGTDEWATRGGQGAYFHWVTGNSILPEEDVINTGIEKVDRTTVPELDELAAQAEAIQHTLDNADSRLNPLGLARGALSFDISAGEVDTGKTHFEQIYDRAVAAIQNAEHAFDNAKDATQFLRRQEDSLDERRHAIGLQEQAFEDELIELYGTPYPDDIGPGKTYAQGYEGPDYFHYAYTDMPDSPDLDAVTLQLMGNYEIPAYTLDSSGGFIGDIGLSGVFGLDDLVDEANERILDGEFTIDYRLNSAGRFVKPTEWSSRRAYPGKLQEAGLGVILAEQRLDRALESYRLAEIKLEDLTRLANNVILTEYQKLLLKEGFKKEAAALSVVAGALGALESYFEGEASDAMLLGQIAAEGFPRVVGLSNDATSAGRVSVLMAAVAGKEAFEKLAVLSKVGEVAAEAKLDSLRITLEKEIAALHWNREYGQLLHSVRVGISELLVEFGNIDQASFGLQQAEEHRRALEARGLAIQNKREVFRKRAAAIVQGYRTRDLAFRVFRNEALEKYRSLFDLSARYTFLAARAYDYETGLLDGNGNSAAAAFYESIVQSRALGVLDDNGQPQFTSSSTGDPGLAGVLAAMDGDWGVAKTRLGFNNPDNYETSFSLRQERFRIIPADTGDGAWKDALKSFRKANVLDDPDVRRYCMQISNQGDLPVPGLVIPFQTTIADGVNFFGQPLAGGDSTFSPTSFATKIRSSGISFKGYIGMESPTSTSGSIEDAGASSPPDPDLGFLDPQALSATPYVYLIPAGFDSMRSPPLGDASTVRTWTVADQAIPLPFNIGNSDLSTTDSFVSAASLSEAPYQIRKHQAFRAVPSGTVFGDSDGFTNNRLIGRSVWNSQWKLVIPGKTLRANPDIGLDVFLETVTDIELFLKTYSYSGN